jgi:ABC-type uncharacterized transport system substrate-binding protein
VARQAKAKVIVTSDQDPSMEMRLEAANIERAAELCGISDTGRSLLMRGALAAIAFVTAFLMTAAAQAHPHVWVTVRTELVYDAGGAATGVRHAWTFDDMYSAFAVQGLDAKIPGQFTRDELQSLADVNAESLKEFEYFTYVKSDGKRQKEAFADVVDYWLDYDPKEQVLTLHFTLPLKAPVKAKVLAIEIYDPEFFIAFAFAENEAVKLVSAPSQCTVATQKPNDGNFPAVLRLDQSFMTSEANAGMGMNFANKLSVKCP